MRKVRNIALFLRKNHSQIPSYFSVFLSVFSVVKNPVEVTALLPLQECGYRYDSRLNLRLVLIMKKPAESVAFSLKDIVGTSWEDSALIQWLTEHGRQLIVGVLLLFVLVIAGYRFLPGGGDAQSDYFNADRSFSQLQRSVENSDLPATKEHVNELQALMKRHPELEAKFDGPIAQTLILLGDDQTAIQFIKPTLERTAPENHPLYTEYTQTTLLIGEEHYQEALAKSEQLHQQMLKQREAGSPEVGDTLFMFNLLRIAMLQKQLELTAEELNTWKIWQQMVATSPALSREISHFAIGNVSLENYIEERVRQLKE